MTTEAESEAGRALRMINSPAQQEAARKAGTRPVKPGSRPRGRPKPQYRLCECGRLTAVLKSGELVKHKHIENGE